METSFLTFNITEFDLSLDEQNQLYQVLLHHSHSEIRARSLTSSNIYSDYGSAAFAIINCLICNKPMSAYLIKMCIQCGESICNSHAIITDPENAFSSTFCINCNPNDDNKQEHKQDETEIKLNYSLSSNIPHSTSTSMIYVLDHFLQYNNTKNALVLIRKFMQTCPLWSKKVYQFLDNSSCCKRVTATRTLNLFEYLLYKRNFPIILSVIQLIKTLQIENKQQIIECIFPLILNSVCCNCQLQFDLETMSIKWLTECNTICNNMLFTNNISCVYDIHYAIQNEEINKDEQLSLFPLEYIHKCSKGQIYSRLFHGYVKMTHYPQKVVNFIKDTFDELKEQKQNDIVMQNNESNFKQYFFNNFSCGNKTEQYYNSFLDNDINEFELLLHIDDEYLAQDLNITNKIHRRKILNNIETLRTKYESFHSFFNNLNMIQCYNKLKSNGIVVFDVFYQKFDDLNSFIGFMEITQGKATKIWNNLPNQQNHD